MRQSPRKLGLLGGIIWHSSLMFERALNEGVNKALGGSSSGDLLVHSYNFQHIADAQAAGDWDGLGATFAADARAMQDAGAEGMISGCTEIPMVATAEDVDVPYFDSVGLHVDAALAFALTD